MFTGVRNDDVFGFLRPSVDAHTLGTSYLAQLLKDAGYECVVGDRLVSQAMNRIQASENRSLLKQWLEMHRISLLGISYRLDPDQASEVFGRTYHQLEELGLISSRHGIRHVFFAGLPDACEAIKREFGERVTVFIGDETPLETLSTLGVPRERIPDHLVLGTAYDNFRMQLSQELVSEASYFQVQPQDLGDYDEFGTNKDSVVARLSASQRKRRSPLMRAHVGPYVPNRTQALLQFEEWTRELANGGLLDILSIGTSQLTQEAFGLNWGSRPNGGGVPVNSAKEYERIRSAARPMLVRTYAGTRDVPALAKIHEESLNIAWHALSFWWFSQIDGRGPNTVHENLRQHLETLDYIAATGKPFEPNIPHHFAFRGGDDISYVLSALLAAKAAKARGVPYLILQIMLNTPKQTSGTQDLAKARTLVRLVRELEDPRFRVFVQPRAGLDFFSPDLNKARQQLAAVSMMMMDIEPRRTLGPDIVHVVSFSEGSFLATPPVVNESIQITRHAMDRYKEFRGVLAHDLADHVQEVDLRTHRLISHVRTMLAAIEDYIPNTYSADGLYEVFRSGFLVAPTLWEGRDEFEHAVNWHTRIDSRGCEIVYDDGSPMSPEDRIEICLANLNSTNNREGHSN